MAHGHKDYRRITVAEDPEGKFAVHRRTKLYDDFEDLPMKWWSNNNDLHSEDRLIEAAYNGSFGLKICAEQTGAPRAYNHMYAYPPLGERQSAEISLYWRSENYSNNVRYVFGIAQRTPTTDLFAQIAYIHDVAAGVYEWQIFMAGGYASIPESERIFQDHWHELTFACDFATGRYLYARADRLVFPLGHIALPDGGGPTPAYMYAVVGVEDHAAAETCMHVDDIWVREL
jgi:hypothetical protein